MLMYNEVSAGMIAVHSLDSRVIESEAKTGSLYLTIYLGFRKPVKDCIAYNEFIQHFFVRELKNGPDFRDETVDLHSNRTILNNTHSQPIHAPPSSFQSSIELK